MDVVHQVDLVARVATVGDAIETFLRIEMADKSAQTAHWYRVRLLALAEWLGPARPLTAVLELELDEYRAALAGRGRKDRRDLPKISAYTLHGHVRAVRRFFRWLYQRDILPADLGRDLKLPKLPRQGRKGISEGNLAAILAAAQDNGGEYAARDYALLLFLESTGVRRGGIEGLLLSDLMVGEDNERLRRRASVREKGNKERTVIMSRQALEALLAWLDVRPAVDDDHVFLGRSPGQEWHALTAGGISGIVSRYKARLGLKGDCSPHQWRHRWARHHLHLGMELSQVSQLLGHEDVSITVRFYGQFTMDQLQEAYDRLH